MISPEEELYFFPQKLYSLIVFVVNLLHSERQWLRILLVLFLFLKCVYIRCISNFALNFTCIWNGAFSCCSLPLHLFLKIQLHIVWVTNLITQWNFVSDYRQSYIKKQQVKLFFVHVYLHVNLCLYRIEWPPKDCIAIFRKLWTFSLECWTLR